MEEIFSDITPQDNYVVVTKNKVDFFHITNLIELYQPIIGTEATCFYLTLYNHLFIRDGISPHRQLMCKMKLSFPIIMKARKSIEAIGLLKSKRYKHKENDEYVFEYCLLEPLSAEKFFQSDILSMLLINQLGKTCFQKLKTSMLNMNNWNNESYLFEEEITKAFDDVFDSVLITGYKNIAAGLEEVDLIDSCGYKNEQRDIYIKKEHLDIEFIKGMISNIYQLNKNLNEDLIRLLQELAFLYHFSEMEIINLLKDHTIYNSSGRIEIEQLRNRAREMYQSDNKVVNIIHKDEITKKTKEKSVETENKAERHKAILENYSPIELMQQYQGGGKVPDSDIKLIEGLLYDFKLPSGVVNVLIEYVMLSNEYKLPKNLVEKIAGHWKRLKINTVDEALAVAKKEHQLYKVWLDPITSGKSKQTKSKPSGKVKREKVPDYIIKQEEKYHKKNSETKNSKNEEVDLEKTEKINQLLKSLGEK